MSEKPFSYMLAFLGVKLCCPKVLRMDDRRKVDSVIRCRQDDVRGFRYHMERVHEVHKARFIHPICEAVGLLRMQLVPAHVRYPQVCRKFDHPALQQVQSAMQTKFFAFGKEEMHSQAYPECRRPGLHLLPERFENFV